LRRGFCTSAAANVTLFQASDAKSEPTSAAPKATMNTSVTSTPPMNRPSPKFAASAVALRPTVKASTISSASAPVFTTVSEV
jgi:hypothetical protein